MSPRTGQYPMQRHGHLHYQVRRLSGRCRHEDHGRCAGAYFSHPGAQQPLIALCTCDCHAYNRAEVAS